MALHAEERKGSGPADKQESINGFDTRQEPECADRINVAEPERAKRLRREIEIIDGFYYARAVFLSRPSTSSLARDSRREASREALTGERISQAESHLTMKYLPIGYKNCPRVQCA
jgi:hypothetical protein